MRIGIDIDDVLFGWYDRAHAACEAAGITNGITPRTWSPFEEYGCDLQTWLDVLEQVTLDGTLYSGDPYPGTVRALHQLHDAGHTIHLVTARGFFVHGDLIRAQTEQWLDDHQVPHDTLTFSKDKTVVATDWFIDDNVANYQALEAAGVNVWLLTRPWNLDAVNARRTPSVQAFVDLVLDVAEVSA